MTLALSRMLVAYVRLLFYIFNSTVIDWTCYILLLQQCFVPDTTK